MNIKTFTAAIILAFVLPATVLAQRRPNAQPQRQPSKPATSTVPEATPQPSPNAETVTNQAPSVNELSDAERKELQLRLTRAETTLQLSSLGETVGVRPSEDARKAPTAIAEVYEQAVRDRQLANAFISQAFDDYYDKPSQSNSRLLLFQSFQNQVLIEQNKKIIQLLEQLTRSKR